MEKINKESSKLFFRLTKNVVALTGIFSVFLVFIYVIGNFQGFQDSTQEIILSALGISSIFFGIVSLFGIIESILFFFIRGILTIWQNLIFLVSMVLCVVIALTFIVISIFLGVLSGGL